MPDGSGREGTGRPIVLFSYSPSGSAAKSMAKYGGVRSSAVLITDGYEATDKDRAGQLPGEPGLLGALQAVVQRRAAVDAEGRAWARSVGSALHRPGLK